MAMSVSSLFEHRIESLARDVRRLDAGNGADGSLYESVRRQVSGELMNRGRYEVVSATAGKLLGERGEDRLKEIVMHCSERLYLDDRVLTAIVVPVAVRLTSRRDGGVVLSEGRKEDLMHLAEIVQKRSGASKVVFDTHLYTGSALHVADPRKIFEVLKRLESGEELGDIGPKTHEVKSCAEPTWEMVYFLGVEVTKSGVKQCLNDLQTQRALKEWRSHAEWALTETETVLFNRTCVTDAKCHGIWYLNKGVSVGEDLMRTYKLKSVIANFDQGVKGVYFFYTHDVFGSQVKLLVSSHLMTIEYRWKILSGETLDGFKKALDEAIDLYVPNNEINEKQELDLFAYDEMAQKRGLEW
jgi:hypothetical protein